MAEFTIITVAGSILALMVSAERLIISPISRLNSRLNLLDYRVEQIEKNVDRLVEGFEEWKRQKP